MIIIVDNFYPNPNEVRKKALKQFLPMQDGDVKATLSSSIEIEKITGFKPKTKLKDGLYSFVKWYKEYYYNQKLK